MKKKKTKKKAIRHFTIPQKGLAAQVEHLVAYNIRLESEAETLKREIESLNRQLDRERSKKEKVCPVCLGVDSKDIFSHLANNLLENSLEALGIEMTNREES